MEALAQVAAESDRVREAEGRANAALAKLEGARPCAPRTRDGLTCAYTRAVLEAARGKRAVIAESRAVSEVGRDALLLCVCYRTYVCVCVPRQLEARVEELSDQVESVTVDQQLAVAGARVF